eukprot:218345_1
MGNSHSSICNNRTELLVYGFIRIINKTIPLQLFQLVFQYYQMVNIYGIGLNQFGCLGLGYKNLADDITTYEKLESLENIIISQIYKGFQSFLFLNYQNKIYVTGNNTANQLQMPEKLDNKAILEPTLIKYFANKKHSILFSSNGIQAKHTFIKTSNNKIYAFGNNTYAQLPQISKTTHTVTIPKQIKCEYDIINIQCGDNFSLFLDINGFVYACGSNQYGQLGMGIDIKQQFDIKKIDGLSDIIDIKCGDQHTLCLNTKGILFGFGYNVNGQLSIPKEKFVYSPTMINIDGNKLIRSIICGAKHSGVLDLENNIYLFGANNAGQIGKSKEERDVFEAVIPPMLKNMKIESLDCGSRHTVVLNESNQIYTFGFNRYKQCSVIMKVRYIYEPYLLKKSEIGITKGSVIQIVAGSYSTLVVTN